MSWICHCGYNNIGRLTQCANDPIDTDSEHYQVSTNTSDWSMSSEIESELLLMTEQEQLFAQFYNQEKVLVKDMDSMQLRTHRDELAKIAFEAKARLVATDEESRERNAKAKNKEWLSTTNEVNPSSDAINAIKSRQQRLSKMDKLRNQLLSAGIDEATVKEMVKNLERTATEKDAKAITFVKPKTPIEVKIEEAREDGIITDIKDEPKPNPFEKFRPAIVFTDKDKIIGLDDRSK